MDDLISFSGNAVQAQEVLLLGVKKNLLENANSSNADYVKLMEALRSVKDALANSIQIKSLLEGSNYIPNSPKVDTSRIADLKKLLWTSDVQSMSQELLQQITSSLQQIFEGVEVEFAVISTNSIYASLYEDPGQKARHNTLFCVYKLPNSDIYGPYPAPVIEQCSVIDEDWLFACELSHFTATLLKGKVRTVLATSLIDGVKLCSSESFDSLLDERQSITGNMSFLAQCTGQAIGSLSKKHSKGMSIKEGATLFEFSESVRMLSMAAQALALLNGDQVQLASGDDIDRSKRLAEGLRSVAEHTNTIEKIKFWEEIVSWANDIQLKVKTFKSVIEKNSSNVVRDIRSWHCSKRCVCNEVNTVNAKGESLDVIKKLQSDVAGFVSTLQPQQILLIVRAGSYLYNLHTATSDTDYLVIYASDTQGLLTQITRSRESHEKRGVDLDVEYGAYEIRLFLEMLMKASVVILEVIRLLLEMLMKASVVILEVLFSDEFEFVTPAFKELQDMRQNFVTEKAIQQYWGLIGNNLKMIRSEKHKDTPRERKLFYQIFHKLGCVEQMISGTVPTVRVSGEQRDFIMNVRTKAAEGEYSRENLVQLAEKQFLELQMKAATRPTRLREAPDPQPLASWLMKLRGLT